MDKLGHDLLVECVVTLDETSNLIGEYVSRKHPDKEITESAIDLLHQRRACTRLMKKVECHLRTREVA